MRVVVCDDDVLLREMVESVVSRTGHEVAGIAETTPDAVHLLEAARPDAVILDLSLGYNTDFDIIETAIEVGARAIVFSHNADDAVLSRYPVRPAFVPKPDLTALEQVLARLDVDDVGAGGARAAERDRRRNPARPAAGPVPTGVSDAHAFFEAVNAAEPGDALVSIEAPAGGDALAAAVTRAMRSTDRLLAFATVVRFLLPGGGDAGIRSFLQRLADTAAVLPSATVRSVIVAEGEHGADAFDRLKRDGDVAQIPAPTAVPASDA